jgi:hypothetical protein
LNLDAAAKDGKAGSVALDRAGIEAASPQYAGNRARQQAARLAWAVLARGHAYQPRITAHA